MRNSIHFRSRWRVLLKQQIQMLKKLGPSKYAKYRLSRRGHLVDLEIAGHLITIRKGTPDLGVALSCLVDGEFRALSRCLDSEFSGIILDAGGYIGTSALALAEMFPQATVITLEPSTDNFEILKKNTVRCPRITPVQGALVGKRMTSVTLRDRGTGEWGFTTITAPRDNTKAVVMQEVPAYTILELVKSPLNVGILKLDIEGAELDLFTQDAGTLRNIKVIVAELHDRIAPGCTEAFQQFSRDRFVFKDDGEKYFSVSTSRQSL